jgi:hypothetical protein
LAELTAQSLCALTDVRYIPGSGELPDIGSGSRLDVRFLADRVVLVPAASPRILAGFSYLDVAAVDIGGPGRIQRWTPGQQAAPGPTTARTLSLTPARRPSRGNGSPPSSAVPPGPASRRWRRSRRYRPSPIRRSPPAGLVPGPAEGSR